MEVDVVILGVADGPAAAAAVVVDDTLVALASESLRVDPSSEDALPWGAVDEVLTIAGLRPDQVDVVAVAGRFSPLLAVRRRPWLAGLLAAPFSVALDAQVLWQAFLRVSGFGAVEADRASEWVDGRFRLHGFAPQRVAMVDAHRALAEASYRLGSDDDVMVVGLQALGDGTAMAVHRGVAGQLDRLATDGALSSLHTHLPRVTSALGQGGPLSPARLGALAARGQPDAALVAALSTRFSAEGAALAPQGGAGGLRPEDPLIRRIRSLPPEVAAASVHSNLVSTISAFVRGLVRTHGHARLAVVGEVFDDPRLVAAMASVDGVARVSATPASTAETLALGAAASQAGLAPGVRDLRVGADVDAEAAEVVLREAGVGAVRRATLPQRLAGGGAVARLRGRTGPGPIGLASRCVLVRADDAPAIARTRKLLGHHDLDEPIVVAIPTPNEGAIPHLDALRPALAVGAAAPVVDDAFRRRYGPSVAPDGRARLMRVEPTTDPGLHAVVQALVRTSGCGAVAAFPLPDPSVSDVVRRLGAGELAAAQVGPFWVDPGSRR